MELPNNGHIGDEHFVHCSEAVPSLEVEMYIGAGGEQFVHCREVVHSSECPLSEVRKRVKLLYAALCFIRQHIIQYLTLFRQWYI